MKKFSLVISVIVMLLVLSGCGQSDSAAPENSTSQVTEEVQTEAALSPNQLTGIVTEIDGSTVTLQTFSIEMPEGVEFDGEMPQMPEGLDGQFPEGMEFDGERPQMPEGFDGQLPEGMEFDGERPQMPEGFDGQLPEGMEFDGERPQMPGMMGMEEGESRTLSLENVRIMSGDRIADIEDISVGTMLTVDFDANGNAVKVSIVGKN